MILKAVRADDDRYSAHLRHTMAVFRRADDDRYSAHLRHTMTVFRNQQMAAIRVQSKDCDEQQSNGRIVMGKYLPFRRGRTQHLLLSEK